MNRRHRGGWLGTALAVVILGIPSAGPVLADEPTSEIPVAFAPFEHLIGSWKGTGLPEANRIKGWPEKHAWSWVFDQGHPIGLSVEMTGDQTLKKARLSFDKTTGDYLFSGIDPAGQAVDFRGRLDDDRLLLTLDRLGPLTGGTAQRLTLRLITNKIRYVIWDDRQEPGAPRFSRFIEINMGKEGEAFAAKGGVASLPKCILTGGAATMTVSYQGKSYPVCCSGCREEFQADPEKYVKKAALRAAAAAKEKKPAPEGGISRVGKDDGSFDALLGDSPTSSKPRGQTMPKDRSESSEPSEPVTKSEDATKPATPEPSEDTKEAQPAPSDDKAAKLLTKAQNLEKRGKGSAAVIFYRIILDDHPRSPQAKTAAERLKALGKR